MTKKDNLNIKRDYLNKITQIQKYNKAYFIDSTPLVDDNIYDELKIKCQPVAINSGYTWPKRSKLNPNLNLIISILKPIEAGMQKERFLEILQKEIYKELDNLN